MSNNINENKPYPSAISQYKLCLQQRLMDLELIEFLKRSHINDYLPDLQFEKVLKSTHNLKMELCKTIEYLEIYEDAHN